MTNFENKPSNKNQEQETNHDSDIWLFYDNFFKYGWDFFIKTFLVYFQEIQYQNFVKAFDKNMQFDVLDYNKEDDLVQDFPGGSTSKPDIKIDWKWVVFKALDLKL